jgi:hypothetical protein
VSRSAILKSTVPADVARRARDHGAQLDVLLEDGAVHGGAQRRVLHPVARRLELGLGTDDRGTRRRVVQVDGLVLGLGDALALEELLGSPLLGLGVLELGARHVEIGLGLRQGVLLQPRIDARDELAGAHLVAGLDPHLDDLAAGLRLHVDGEHRLDDPGSRDAHVEIAPGDGDLLIEPSRRLLFAAAGDHEERDRDPDGMFHGGPIRRSNLQVLGPRGGSGRTPPHEALAALGVYERPRRCASGAGMADGRPGARGRENAVGTIVVGAARPGSRE